MIFWGRKRAQETGFECAREGRVHWFGKRGMCWNELMGQMTELLKNSPPPSKLIIHLGGNDLGKVPLGALIYNIRRDLRKMAAMMPRTKIIWSDLTARRSYRHARDNAKVEKSRKTLNKTAHKIVSEIKGFFIEHKDIKWNEAELYRNDGVHMSNLGNDILLHNWFNN